MKQVVFYDCEFLTADGSPSRFWCGPQDPDPLCVQIGAVKLDLETPFTVSGPVGWYITPRDRDGAIVPTHPVLTTLTGIDNDLLSREGIPLEKAMAAFADYADGALLFSWGKDELLTLAVSLFVQGLPSPIPATQFRNAPKLLVTAGENIETVNRLRSSTICDYFGLTSHGRAHDARDDAAGVAKAMQHLLKTGRLTADDFMALAPSRAS